MTREAILDAVHHDSRLPKSLQLTDGSSLAVEHADMLVFPGEHGPRGVCILFRSDGGFRVINLAHVVSVAVGSPTDKK
jgi:hypothetical protein